MFYDEQLPAGTAPTEVLMDKLHEAVSDGFVLLLVSGNSLRPQWVAEEIKEAIRLNGVIIPLFIDDVLYSVDIPEPLRNISGLCISSKLKDVELEMILNRIEESIPYIRNKK